MNQPSQPNGSPYLETVTLKDETGRSLCCTLEYSFELEGEDYALLMPVDTPVEVLALNEDGSEEDAVPAAEEEIDEIFDTAKAVLSEYNLKLQRTAIVLTVEGELPEMDDEESEDDAKGGNDYEEFLWIASFYHEEQEYAVCSPLEPFFILSRLNASGEPEVLSDEDYQKLEPMMPSIESILEEQLFADLD
ncbi:MAG TPA: DUF3727 domain-containing protein [Oscillatoriales cyanobacterium M59_W2019_021]|nr:MAG: DUF3727 domain-containing protein [Cyanobacteria bacterium J055]HIK32822.1 DUF3727 domain-containing protein [Oscillatoriales cyanobacterium M4454_W2019_049]HIK51819.1 DUF3727 domain-containing protein [Oscillatoriales cyanobacterium M59_W2019_021]